MLVLEFGKGTRMTGFRRALALAAALNASLLVGTVSAQTVIVTKAPPEATVELFLNGSKVGSMPASATGEATLALDLKARDGRTEMDARIYLDTCPGVRRVQIVERGLEAPALQSGCGRKDLIPLFLMRQVTSLVVDATEGSSDAWLRQGPAPKSWLTTTPDDNGPAGARSWPPAPSGLTVFGGGAFTSNTNTRAIACGNSADCSSNGYRPAFTAGAAYWISPNLAVEGSYVKPGNLTVTGGDQAYIFRSELATDIVTVGGKVGGQAGPVRIYGFGGMNYQFSDFSTLETTGDFTITVDEETQLIAGGTQELLYQTKGWGWMFGGGVEIWVAPKFGIYGEFARLKLNGSDTRGGEGTLDDHLTTITIGIRFAMTR